MKPNRIKLNPRRDVSANPLCPRCGEKIKEVSTEHENWFECGCEQLIEFKFEVKKNKGIDVGESDSGILEDKNSGEKDSGYNSELLSQEVQMGKENNE